MIYKCIQPQQHCCRIHFFPHPAPRSDRRLDLSLDAAHTYVPSVNSTTDSSVAGGHDTFNGILPEFAAVVWLVLYYLVDSGEQTVHVLRAARPQVTYSQYEVPMVSYSSGYESPLYSTWHAWHLQYNFSIIMAPEFLILQVNTA